MSDGFYDTAQICLNGNVINDNFRLHPQHDQRHCNECGEPTIIDCQHCRAEIRGSYEVPGVAVVGGAAAAPAFCHACGRSYPWIEKRLAAAKDLAEEFDQLDEAEIQALKGTLDDLIRDTPKTEVAGFRFKKLIKKAGKEAYNAMKDILTDLVSETVKKSVLGQ